MRRALFGVLAMVSVIVGGAAVAQPSAVSAQTEPTGIELPCNPLGSRIELLCTITSFENTDGVLTATGIVSAPGGTGSVPFAGVPVESLSAGPGNSCRILSLVLGPIDLNVLGLDIETNQIELDITAERGPGNLLGNLLCAVTGLFDAGAPTDLVAGLLNFLLGQL